MGKGGHAVTDKPRDVAVKISWRWSQLTDLIGLWTRVEAAHGDGELHEQLVDAVKALVDSLYEAVVGNIPTHMVLPRQDGGKLWFAPLKGERKMKLLDTSAVPIDSTIAADTIANISGATAAAAAAAAAAHATAPTAAAAAAAATPAAAAAAAAATSTTAAAAAASAAAYAIPYAYAISYAYAIPYAIRHARYAWRYAWYAPIRDAQQHAAPTVRVICDL